MITRARGVRLAFAGIAAALLCAGLAGFALKLKSKPPTTKDQPATAGTQESAPPAAAAAAPEAHEVTARAPKRRGIRFGDFARGSLADPSAPPYPSASYCEKREAELKKWRETTIDLTYDDVPLHEITAELLRKWGLKVGIDAGVTRDAHISVQISGLDAASSMEFFTEIFDMAWVVDGNGESWLVPLAKKHLYETKEGRELSEIEAASAAMLADRTAEAPNPLDAALEKRLDGTRFTPDRAEMTLSEFQKELIVKAEVYSQTNYKAVPNSTEVKLSLAVEETTVRQAIDAAILPAGLVWFVGGGIVNITTAEARARGEAEKAVAEAARKERAKTEDDVFAKTVALEGDDLAIRDVAERISKALGIGYSIDPATWSRAAKYGFDGELHTLREIFAALAKGAPVEVTYREGKLWYVSRGDGK
ncbi:MAG: hypothetical protein FD180_3641 [Planctomycetota bacterium]|nr:MAG: hypothetical protein FD180_3641 [Planctomycetota bacterium]